MADEDDNRASEEGGSKGGVPWVPLLLTLLIVPVLTLALTEFVVIPRLQAGGGAEAKSAAAHDDSEDSHGGKEKKDASEGSRNSYSFDEVIANLSGTMGTRFIKVSFEVAGQDSQLRSLMRMKKPRVQDAIISTLSSRTIQDIEAAGGRNALRIALISGINQAVGLDIVEELFFTEFIIQ